MTQSGTDVVLALSGTDQVVFQNTLLADFNASNFGLI